MEGEEAVGAVDTGRIPGVMLGLGGHDENSRALGWCGSIFRYSFYCYEIAISVNDSILTYVS